MATAESTVGVERNEEKWLKPRMWYLIPARFVGAQLFVFALLLSGVASLLGESTAPGMMVGNIAAVIMILGSLLFLASLLAIVPLLTERKRLKAQGAKWQPGLLHYLIAIPGVGIGIPLAMLYTYKRLKWVGPSSQKL